MGDQAKNTISSCVCLLIISALLLAGAKQLGFFDVTKWWSSEASDASTTSKSSGSLTPTQPLCPHSSRIRLTQTQTSKTGDRKNLGLDWKWVVVIGAAGLLLAASVGFLLFYLFRKDEKFDDLEEPVRPKRRRSLRCRRRHSA